MSVDNLSPEYLNSIVTFVVGLIALMVYWLSKRHEKKAAAAIVVMDIRHAEQVILALDERNIVDKNMKTILHENNWVKYQHLFASDFSYDDLSAFNRFFDSCVEIADAKRRMNEVFYVSVTAKAAFIQQTILAIEDIDTPAGQDKRTKIIERCNKDSFAFEAADPKNTVLQQLKTMGRPSNSVAFAKLKRIAGFMA